MEKKNTLQPEAFNAESYVSPVAEITEVVAEQGFAISVPGTLPGFGDGGTW